jgi:O-antigen ligase
MNDLYEIHCVARPRRFPAWIVPVLLLSPLFVLASSPPYDWYATEKNPDWDSPKDPTTYIQYAEKGNTVRQIAMFIIGGFGLVNLLRPGGARLHIDPLLAGLVGFFTLWAGTSILWSDEPGVTLRKLGVFLLFALAAAAVAKRLSLRDVLMFALASCAFHVLFVGLCDELSLGTFRPWVPSYRFGGMAHPNGQGEHASLMLLAAFALACERGSQRMVCWATVFFSLVFLLLTKARASIGATIAALGFVGILARRYPWKWPLALLAAALACCLLLVVGDELPQTIQKALFLGRTVDVESGATTLNSRVPLWQDCFRALAERPIAGFGYDSFWSGKRLRSMSGSQGWAMYSAHNTYLDMALGLGFVGLLVFVSILLLTITKASLRYSRSQNVCDAFICALLVSVSLTYLLESAYRNISCPALLVYATVLRTAFFAPGPGGRPAVPIVPLSRDARSTLV